MLCMDRSMAFDLLLYHISWCRICKNYVRRVKYFLIQSE